MSWNNTATFSGQILNLNVKHYNISVIFLELRERTPSKKIKFWKLNVGMSNDVGLIKKSHKTSIKIAQI